MGPVSTKKEKLMKLRANVWNNEPGVMTNGEMHAPPNEWFVTKLDNADRLEE